MNRLRACLRRHPTHGRGWAVVTLWAAYCRQVHATSDAKKRAIHFGAASFLELEGTRIEKDRGWPRTPADLLGGDERG
jgi:hypothetical protein